MVLSFLDLKNSRAKSLESLTTELQKQTAPKFVEDDRIWYPDVDKAGNGYAVIRFLPAPRGEEVPFVRVWFHSFQGKTGSWYIENSLTTLGKPDPVSEYNSILWNSGQDSDKEVARKQKRKLTYISNILVMKDIAHPENEGKVFLFRYGKKIFDKLNNLMIPQFPDEPPINPFDFWAGVPLRLKICIVEGYRNYDQSEFVKPPSPLTDNDEELEKIWNQQHSLQEFVSGKNFKTYDELKARLDRVLGTTGKRVASVAADVDDNSPPPFDVDETDEEHKKTVSLFQSLVNKQ
jgi:hypothetical protein